MNITKGEKELILELMTQGHAYLDTFKKIGLAKRLLTDPAFKNNLDVDKGNFHGFITWKLYPLKQPVFRLSYARSLETVNREDGYPHAS